MANNTNYKPNEGKREEFRRYLEKTGVMDALTKVLVLLYEEADKPDDALKFILNALSRQIGSESIDELKAQITTLQDKVGQLETDKRVMSQGSVGGAPPGSNTAQHGSSATAQHGGSATAQQHGGSSTAQRGGSSTAQRGGSAPTLEEEESTTAEQPPEGAEEAHEKPVDSAVALEEPAA